MEDGISSLALGLAPMARNRDSMDGLGHSTLVELMNLPLVRIDPDPDAFQLRGSTKGRNLHVRVRELRMFRPVKRTDACTSPSSLPAESTVLALKKP